MNKQLTYQNALEELKTIISALETGEVTIDELTEKIERANFLLTQCKAILYKTEEEVNKAFENNEQSNLE